MTNFENFKTHTDWEKSFIIKVFSFQFINNFNSLFYIAFLKRDIEGCLDYNLQGKLTLSKDYKCFNEIYSQLRSIFIIAILKNFVELGIPIALEFWEKFKKTKTYSNLKESKKDKDKLLLRIEKNLDKSIYGDKDLDGTYEDYSEIITQIGYVLLFGLAFPLCIVLALINNIIEHQVDRAKILYFSRRPKPLGAENIGSWGTIYYILMIVGVFCYSGILCITAQTFSDSRAEAFIQFVWCSIIFLILTWSVSYIIKGTPYCQKIILDRHQFVVDKSLVKLSKDVNKTSVDSLDLATNLAVRQNHTNASKHLQESLLNISNCEINEESKEIQTCMPNLKLNSNDSNESNSHLHINNEPFEPNYSDNIDKSIKLRTYK